MVLPKSLSDVYKRQPQYNILAKEVPQGDYWELFTDQMLCSCGKTPIVQWLARYRELTGVDYCDGFQEWHRSSDRAFALLVERKEIRLWQFFEQHQGDGPSAQPMKLLLGYAMNISSWQGFRFVRRLLQKYTPVQLQKFFGERFFFQMCIRDRNTILSMLVETLTRMMSIPKFPVQS